MTKFKSYKTPFGDQSWIWVEIGEFVKTVCNSNFISAKFKFLNWGKSGFPKLLLIFHNNLKNSQHESCSTFWALQLSCWSLFKIPNRIWIGDSNWKRGHFLEICIFKITLNFVLKLQKLKTPKLYIMTRSTTFLLNSTTNFAWFLNCAKGGKIRLLKSGFPPQSFGNLSPYGFSNQHKHQYTM